MKGAARNVVTGIVHVISVELRVSQSIGSLVKVRPSTYLIVTV